MPQEQFYDGAFAELFHHPKFIRSLLTDLVDEEWVGHIDFSSMRIEEEEHKGVEDRPLRSDLVISFEFLAGPESEYGDTPFAEGFSIYLLLLEYLSRVYRRQRREHDHLRPVVPIVIYNGIPRWREDPDFSRHFACIHDSLRPYLPLYRYILIDEGRYDEKLLRKLKGAVSTFFRIDTVDLKNRTTAADSIIEVLREEGREEGLEEGREEGFELCHQKGYGQGELKGKQNSLLRQLAKKFSLVTEDERIITGCENSDKLDEALDVILFADTNASNRMENTHFLSV